MAGTTASSWKSPRTAMAGVVAVAAITLFVYWVRAGAEDAMVATVTRGELTARLTSSGTLKPIQSITYRSPIPGRDVEIRDLAPEGSRVDAGDLLVKLDTTDLDVELARVRQEHRQVLMDLQVAEGEFEEAGAEVKAVTEGEGALTVEEARSTLLRAQKKTERLRQEYEHLKPLLDKGFITRDELARTEDQLEEAEEELILLRRRTDVVVELSHPREQKRAALALAQKSAQLGHARTRAAETQLRLETLDRLIAGCTIRARGPGLVVYEENLNSNPRRKLRIGDRVFATQGIVTIPEVNRMLVEASVSESEVHRVKTGQPAEIRVEAFPELTLTGKVTRVGTLASSSVNRPFDDKRFDLVITLDPTAADLRPEMTIRADVIVGSRTNVLMVPVTAVFNSQGTRVVYVTGATGTGMRPVDLGESNDRMVEIVAGLREGERVSLSAPPAAGAATLPRGNALQPR
ncbi:MAG TPA: HlyD family efflux transporter periplasmic adaptor subunit [Vicinamibacterales bacterium]|nr:HlyD family efflux transporter periplasmic adaptor subunit [Vicinamibacterales bacterium]